MSKQNAALVRLQKWGKDKEKMSTRDQPAEDWVQSLFLKRRRGRRILPESLPPYATDDGLIFNDRRSHEDRRKTIGPAAGSIPKTE